MQHSNNGIVVRVCLCAWRSEAAQEALAGVLECDPSNLKALCAACRLYGAQLLSSSVIFTLRVRGHIIGHARNNM